MRVWGKFQWYCAVSDVAKVYGGCAMGTERLEAVGVLSMALHIARCGEDIWSPRSGGRTC